MLVDLAEMIWAETVNVNVENIEKYNFFSCDSLGFKSNGTLYMKCDNDASGCVDTCRNIDGAPKHRAMQLIENMKNKS
jgi:hypothetical protein